MVPFVSVIYVKSVHQARFDFLGEKFRFIENSGSGYAVLSHKAGNRASILNVHTKNFSSGFF